MVNPDRSSSISSSSKASSVTTETSGAKTKGSIYSKIRRFHHSKHHHHHLKDDKRASDEQLNIQTIPIDEAEEVSPPSSESPRTDVGNKPSEGVNLSSPTPANSEIDVNGNPSTTLERLIAMDKEQERRAKELTEIMLNIQKMAENYERKQDPREEDDRGLKVPQGQVIHHRTPEFPNARGGIRRMTVNWPENFGPRSFRLRFFSMLTKLLAHSLNYLSMTHLLPCQTEYELYRTIPWTIKPPRSRPSPTVIEPDCEDEEGANSPKGRRPPNIKTRSTGAAHTKNQ